MRYAVSIPAPDASGLETRLTVEATDWMSALRLVLGDAAAPSGPDLLCDLRVDGSVRVVDARSQRVIELRPEEPGALVEVSPVRRFAGSPPLGAARLVERREHPSGSTERQAVDGAQDVAAPLVDADLLGKVLCELDWGYEEGARRSLREVAERMLDLALRLVPSTSGAVLFAGLQSKDLFFAAARGPKAAQVMGFRVPLEQGIVGFCVREGVSLAVPRAAQDSRLYRAIGESIGLVPGSVACAPLKHEGRVFGAIELLDREPCEQGYTAADVALLSAVASQFAHWLQLQL